MEPYQEQIDKLSDILSSRGYKTPFTANPPPPHRPVSGKLEVVLKEVVAMLQSPAHPFTEFDLKTFIQYRNINENLKSTFKLRLDEKRGFLIYEQHISHNSQVPTVLRYRTNIEVLGALAIQTRFPKPVRPWENLLKGRPHRRH